MAVKDIMVEEVITVNPDTKVKDAVELMNKHEIGCLVVTKKGRPVGIITERDVLKKMFCQSKNSEQVRVSEIMSAPLVVGKVDMDLGDAARLMLKQNVKKLPIVSGENLVGLVTLTDIVRVDHIEHLLINIIKQLRKNGWNPPKRMNKIVGLYIT
ncbi:MAG: CBS domain-containing protein [Candidatus Bathyarchaeota archaeon]|nr:CBS domain-containing protein [Candidatus Bathyarchaeota archaeon]MDH5734038.1 CBS domain-containing protein [Candidatus Bathyarchaeota archaeon]